MELQQIDKVLYRKRLNILIAISITVLLVSSLSISNILITLFGSNIDGDNFWWNISGVAVGLLIVMGLFKVLVSKPFMLEVNYVRQLKQEMNRIYRHSKKVQAGVDANNKTALIISYFNLQASKQVYELDNNTLTMDELNEKIQRLDDKLENLGLVISASDYDANLLATLD